MRNEPYFHVGYTHKINFSSTHNITKNVCIQKGFQKMTQEKKLEVIFYGNLAFWNFYVMGATEIAYVKVVVNALQKM